MPLSVQPSAKHPAIRQLVAAWSFALGTASFVPTALEICRREKSNGFTYVPDVYGA